MKRAFVLGLGILPLMAAAQDWHWRAEDRETLHQSFHVAAGANASKLVVDEHNGYIHVTGGSGSEIQVTVDRHTRGESQAMLDQAKKDVRLDMSQQGNTVTLKEMAPWVSSDGSIHYDSDRYGYEVEFNCEIQVPEGVTLDLLSHNGAIEVRKSSGDFTVKSHNGHVTMEEIGGSGSLETWNGAVKASFTRVPMRDSSLLSHNGAIDVFFNSTPDANFDLETHNGGVYSDFDVTTMPSVVKGDNLGSRFVYRAGGTMKVRSGKGGPALVLHTWNGAIRLHSKV